jgi:hypothetical protein
MGGVYSKIAGPWARILRASAVHPLTMVAVGRKWPSVGL